MGCDRKQLAWIILHSVLFALLCAWDTHFTARLRGAPVVWKRMASSAQRHALPGTHASLSCEASSGAD